MGEVERYAEWLYRANPKEMTVEDRSHLVNACGFFLARARSK